MRERWTVVAGVLWVCGSAVQAAEPPLFAAERCGERMSCIGSQQARSLIEGARLNYSPIPVADVASANPCAADDNGFVAQGKITACEIHIAKGEGTTRQRAEDLYHLGHSYTFTDFEVTDGMPNGFRHAVETWNRAISIDPSFVDPYVSKALLIAEGERPLDALPVLDEAIRIAPGHWWPHSTKAKAYYNARNYEAAEKEARRAVGLVPDKHIPMQVLARVLAAGGRHADAAEWFLKAGQRFDNKPMLIPGMMRESNPWWELARAYGQDQLWGKADAAITHFLQSVEEAEWHPRYLVDRAGYRENMGQYGAAADDLDRAALMMSQQDVSGLRMHRARLLVKAGRLGEAEDEFRGLMLKADVQQVLQLQVFLKNAGFEDIKIKGQYDELTRQALASCLRETACISKHGQRL